MVSDVTSVETEVIMPEIAESKEKVGVGEYIFPET